MFRIGPYSIDSKVILAPMAGITDRPFRQLCRRLGAGMAVSEMVISDTAFWKTRKSAFRLDHTGEATPRSVQIAGSDPAMMADAARMNAERGAQIIDINMGCPAKKVCNRAAGSALMREPELVKEILEAVVNAVDLPVTLKMRTGWCPESRNGIELARMAEAIGIQALAVHGRTRADGYRGEAEYDTLARIRDVIQIPLFANGDIDSPEKAHQVLSKTGADAVMIGRAAQGRPWLFREIDHYLRTGQTHPAPPQDEISTIMQQHLQALHRFYGEVLGLRIARKHIGWYLQHFEQGQAFRKSFNTIESVERQSSALANFLAEQRRTAA
ncbi:MAG: tRNA dihydrouridine synthase DusB [Nitrincola lacisaponensis]|uniref:tRNA dihydrouridine synthase DusB n=1 Tax=Nitrincola lacisaponensis TaxID=267850 RepID=UPI00391D8635